MEWYNLQTMFDIVKRYFAKEYGYTGIEIELSNFYQNSINSYIYNDRVNPAFVHIDELFESTVMGVCWQCLNGLRILGILRRMGNDSMPIKSHSYYRDWIGAEPE